MVEPLLEGLDDRLPSVREAAAGALDDVGDPRAIPKLEYVALHDAWWLVEDEAVGGGYTVREAAERSLEELRGSAVAKV